MSVLWILLKTGGPLVMWTCILLFFCGKSSMGNEKCREKTIIIKTAYIFSLCVFFVMAAFYNFLWNRKENKGTLDKRDLFKAVVSLAPF